MAKKKLITIKNYQAYWVDDYDINLSHFVQKKIDERMRELGINIKEYEDMVNSVLNNDEGDE